MDEMTERLAADAAAGDRRALDELLARIAPKVLRQCGRILPCPQDAEEACQDALLLVARSITRFEGRSRFTTWLYVVVANCARQTYRSLKRRAAERTDLEASTERPDPRTTSIIVGSRLDLLDALERLDAERPELVAPLVLRDLCQLGYDEIAAQLRCSEGAARTRVHRGLARLNRLMEETA